MRLRTDTRAADAVRMDAALLSIAARDEQIRRSNHQADDDVSLDVVILLSINVALFQSIAR